VARPDPPPHPPVDPLFDGHLERPLSDLSPEERLDWLWQVMELVHLATPAPPGDGEPPPTVRTPGRPSSPR
jgi:hypothetical protein